MTEVSINACGQGCIVITGCWRHRWRKTDDNVASHWHKQTLELERRIRQLEKNLNEALEVNAMLKHQVRRLKREHKDTSESSGSLQIV